jgi:hypothetical protein
VIREAHPIVDKDCLEPAEISDIGVARPPCELDCVLIHPGLPDRGRDGFETDAVSEAATILASFP